MTAYSPEQIARVCHAANSALQELNGDECRSLPWDEETEEARKLAVAGIEAALTGASPEQLHARWCRDRAADGWRRGAFKDPLEKVHPSLVPYADLPEGERVKDAVVAAVTAAMSGSDRVRHLEAEAPRLRGLLRDRGRGDEAREFLTVGEAARALRVHTRTLRRLEDAGRIAPVRTPGGRCRYRAADVEALRRARNARGSA